MAAIVVVSHSEPLAHAAVELAMQMAGENPPVVEIAAGNDGGLGTDAVAVASAIQRADEASDGAGVLVLSDLGSAVLSSEMSLELVDHLRGEVLPSRAPFIEGLVAAVVQASIGRSLVQMEAEAVRAAGAKVDQLGPTAGDATADESNGQTTEPVDDGGEATNLVTRDVTVVNPQGLHARPAALLVSAAAKLPVEVTISNITTGAGPATGDSMLELMTIGGRQGHTIRLSASGPDAAVALQSLAELIESGLGECPD